MGLNKFAELLKEYSGGRITLTVQSGGSLGSEIEMLEGVQMGTLEMSIASTPSMSGFVDSMNYFDLPYLFKSKSSAWSVMDEWLAKDRCDSLQGSGFKGLGFYENGTYMIASNKKIEHPADAKGLRIRAHSSKLQCDALAAIGANPLSVAWGDIYTSLQQGTIDGVSGTTLTNMYGGKFYEQTKYITMTAHHFIPAPIVMNEDLWKSLSPEDQKIVQKAFDESVTYQRDIAYKYADDAKKTIVESGVQIIEADADEWSKAMSSVYDSWVGNKGIEKDMITKIQESEKQYLK
jgi:tripartite ATP-independent transporter DctP family solute receptor